MIRLVTRGCFTHKYVKGLVEAPEDREPAVRKLIEGAGGKLVKSYFTTGDTDFIIISEAARLNPSSLRCWQRWRLAQFLT